MEQLCLKAVGDDTCKLLTNHVVPCSADPDGGWITVPTTPFTEIAPRLWQGGCYHYDQDELTQFDAVLTLNGRAKPAPDPVAEMACYISDSATLPDFSRLMKAVDWAYVRWTQGEHVLVRCQAGLNRSGLVVALLLYRHGFDIGEAIERIRTKRSPYALCNTTFERYLRNLP